MAEGEPSRIRVLGSLDVRVADRPLPLGGGKQRAVLALLLLRAGELVTMEQLVDGLWGEESPPSAAHTIEGYVSRLRGVLEPAGVTLRRRGTGYVLELPGRTDAGEAEALGSAAATALGGGRHEEAMALAAQALELWRGPVLADVPLRGWGLVEAERLDELRLRVVETWADAELELGRPAQVVAELTPLVARNPYRERFVAQLMLALSRCGRQVEALEQYEHLRRRLDEDLGLQPSADLRRLSMQIVQQDPALLGSTAPAAGPDAAPAPPPPSPPAAAPRRRRALVAAALGLTALGAAAIALLVATGGESSDDPSPRVALVVPRDPAASPQDAVLTAIVDGLHRAEREYGVEGEVIVADEFDEAGFDRVTERIGSSRPGLVVLFGGGLASGVPDLARASPATRFVLIDADVPMPNATTLQFDDGEAGYLAGYLSGLMEASDGERLNAEHTVSTIGGLRGVPSVEALLDGFEAGVHAVLPEADVVREYAEEFSDPAPCEAIANRQIDAGSDIVFAAAGRCSLGAIAAAGIRRVWAVGVDADQSYLGDQVLVSTVKRYDQAVPRSSGPTSRGRCAPGWCGSACATRRWGSRASRRTCPTRSAVASRARPRT